MEFHWSNVKYIIAIILYLFSGRISCLEAQISFHRISDCICSGDIVTYQCTVCSGVLTVWEGTAFDCYSSSDEIRLAHRDFGTSASFRECNNCRIVGRGLSVDNECYTSQLNVMFEPGLQNRTVICSVDDGTQSSEVGRDVLHMSTESSPAPTASVQDVNQTEILFSWNQTYHCPSLYNEILSNNCGICPNRTTSTLASCVNFTTSADVKVCEFKLRVVTCGNSNTQIRGNSSTPVLVNLTVPHILQVLSIPHYHMDDGLRGLTTKFAEVVPFIIYEGINGSIESYTVTYSGVGSGSLCSSQTIPANDGGCSTGANVCITEFNVSSSLCPQTTDVVVTVFVTTNLGDGPNSDPIIEEYQNDYVTVEVISQTISINCTFPERITGAIDRSCNATIIYGPNCRNRTDLVGEIITDNLISIKLRIFLAQTRASRYCGFVANVTAGEKFLTVEGSINFVILLDGGDNGAAIAAAVLAVVVVVVVVIMLAVLYRRNKRVQEYEMNSIRSWGLSIKIPGIHSIDEACNMIKFAKKLHPTYHPDSGKGYFQLQIGSEEYISATTEVVLINEDKTEMCAGPEARKLLGFRNKTQPVKIPESFKWIYVFIQSTSRIRKLPKGTHFIIYPEDDEVITQDRSLSMSKSKGTKSETSSTSISPGLQIVEEQYYQLYYVHEECALPDFVEQKKITTRGNIGLGYCFYEFSSQQLTPYYKQVILMDQKGDLYHGPDARRVIGLDPGYDEAKERQPPSFSEDSRWKKAFVTTTSNARKLRPNTQFLYCTIATKETEKVKELFETFKVTEEDEDKRKLLKFARSKIPDYNPMAGYGYYEFTKKGYVLRGRNVMALKRNGELYTGLGVRRLIGAAEDYDPTIELDPPTFTEEDEWDCIFIQGKTYERILEINTRFLYCEYDMPTKE